MGRAGGTPGKVRPEVLPLPENYVVFGGCLRDAVKLQHSAA